MAAEGQTSGTTPGERHAIGICFGNSNSSIAYTSVEDKAEVIANEDGDRQIPSILSYVDGEEYNGQQAKQQLIRNSKNTVAHFRDFLGQDFKSIDPTHCHASAHPQEFESTIAFKIQDKEGDEESTVTVSEITTRNLKRLAQSASDFTGKQVNSAVITVPTNFSEKQKEALTKSANGAGLEVLQLIHEPVAALLAYDARPESKVSDKTVVVADLGGTRSDVAVIASRGGMYTILATAHDYEYAGSSLDKVLMDHFAKEFIKWNATDPRENARSLAKLKLESEATKKALSIGTNANFSVESLAEGIDFTSTINRMRYETIARKVFEGFNRLIEGVVKKAGLDVLDIDEVILSGGTSHTPKIASNMVSIFPESTTILAPSTTPTAISPSELQARGAALQANLIQEYEKEDIEQSTHPAVTTVKHLSNAIGVLAITGDESKGVFTPIISAETAVPARRTIHINTPKEGGDVLIKIVEGGSHIKVTKPEPKSKTNGEKQDDDSEDEDDSDEEPEDIREKVWKVGNVLAEAAVKGVKKGGKVEIMVNVAGDLAVTVTCREIGGKGGVRGNLAAP
ncbi:probable heat shock protein HSP70 (regulator protein involved in pleiotropic drug resistance) [Phialocephala subalpina]|jgi:molecular chaperone DnaK (HSP70)|uniref:Probable heat shock protein HSP70 (Regulator protein involved in pleiotropic drug resistance) n=1 Tax=Phialocephala subalpina TaxID=576137 RepID=A0A1L7X1G8_9HELO|nr:probable heat shock protein HSP70 (regulator protein involved in pleiotropic drug resistance) [Phialocephala subalpina]